MNRPPASGHPGAVAHKHHHSLLPVRILNKHINTTYELPAFALADVLLSSLPAPSLGRSHILMWPTVTESQHRSTSLSLVSPHREFNKSTQRVPG